MKKLLYVIVISAVMVFGLTFVYKNQQLVTVDYYGSEVWGFSWEGQLSLLVITTFILGMLVGFLLVSLSNIRLRSKLINSNRKLKKVEAA